MLRLSIATLVAALANAATPDNVSSRLMIHVSAFSPASTFAVSVGWSRVVFRTLSTPVSLLLFSDSFIVRVSPETVLQLVELPATGEDHDSKRRYPMWISLLVHSIEPREA